jgi:GT2 family glycosyltransferase
MSQVPQATVVVVTWNGAHLLPGCLRALRTQTAPARIVVVDNGSTDDSVQVLGRYPEADVVRSEVNLGFAGGATLGLDSVRTPYAVVLNNDAVPEPTWLAALLAGFDRDDVAAVTSKVLLMPRYVQVATPVARATDIASVLRDQTDVSTDVVVHEHRLGPTLTVPVPDGTAAHLVVEGRDGARLAEQAVVPTTPRCDLINSTGGVLLPTGHGADRGYLEVDRGQYDDQLDVFAVCGAAAAFRTSAGRALGWFDPWLFAYYEDLDLSWRLRRRGWRIRYAPGAVVRHHHAATSGVGTDFFRFHNQRNRLATALRNASAAELARMAVASARRDRPVGTSRPLLSSAAGRDLGGRAAALSSLLPRVPSLLADRRR